MKKIIIASFTYCLVLLTTSCNPVIKSCPSGYFQLYSGERLSLDKVATLTGKHPLEPAHKLKIDQNKLQNCRSNILNLVNVL
ncbi:hypothetical protein D1AOALGA4SA_9326 [Olavius algarvensis Delta 1 endosymbiont]|nr:hypothetical protein D1AOALGA4SA_9326 [Olavius algarvensis Delta 1 endosymbiont]